MRFGEHVRQKGKLEGCVACGSALVWSMASDLIFCFSADENALVSSSSWSLARLC